MWALFAGEEQLTPVLPLTSLSLQPSGGRRRQMNSLITDDRPPALQCVVSLLKCDDGVYKRSNASMDKSFDGMHEKYDFDSIQFSVKKTISFSISMIVTSVNKTTNKCYSTTATRLSDHVDHMNNRQDHTDRVVGDSQRPRTVSADT